MVGHGVWLLFEKKPEVITKKEEGVYEKLRTPPGVHAASAKIVRLASGL